MTIYYYDSVSSAMALINNIVDWLTNAIPNMAAGTVGAQYRQQAGSLKVNAEFYVRNGGLAAPLLNLFNLTRLMGATFESMDAVRVSINDATNTGLQATAIQNAGIRYCLAQQGRILAGTTFVSREDVNTYMNEIIAAFADAVEVVADTGESATYMALIALRSAIIHDLTARGRLLPYVVNYTFARTFPTLTMANRLYPEATMVDTGGAGETIAQRSDDLISENKIVHPLFMPLQIRALSA
jgi:prophage DNA circulation protein